MLIGRQKTAPPSEWSPNNRPPSGSESTFWNIGATAKLSKVQLIGGTFSPCSFHKQTLLPPTWDSLQLTELLIPPGPGEKSVPFEKSRFSAAWGRWSALKYSRGYHESQSHTHKPPLYSSWSPRADGLLLFWGQVEPATVTELKGPLEWGSPI